MTLHFSDIRTFSEGSGDDWVLSLGDSEGRRCRLGDPENA